jgi:hypothetical protein
VLANSLFLSGCGKNYEKSKKTVEAEILVNKYCTSCHASASPQLLDKETWQKSVLPAMGKKLGIFMWSGQYFPEDMRSGISITDWQKIVSYFSENSPVKLPRIKFIEPGFNASHFKIIKPAVYDTSNVASTTMVKFNRRNKSIYTSDVLSQSLYHWDSALTLKEQQRFVSPVVDITFDDKNKTSSGSYLVTLIGSINPNDSPRGEILSINSEPLTEGSVLASALPRPVKTLTADFDKDGFTDILVCGFGNTVGGLYLLKQKSGINYERITISDRPGSIQAIIGDVNKDGWPDIICLFAQGDEGIWMYLNDKKGSFKSLNVLRFPPLYGSSSFQLVDFNSDGHEDILYTSGDNSDYSRILKPYHGIYIYMNNGRNFYKQAYFYPINGSTKAVATDLNNDGKMDLASIAFFSNSRDNPRESFMYLIQQGDLKFKPYSLPVEKLGKWLCMEVNDIDNDGDPDIILGNFSIRGFNQPGVNATWDTKLPFIVLKNQFSIQ